jgi:c-di-GMP phosphodiesterase
MSNLYIARQPIYDRALNVFAYELLYRDDTQNRAEFINGDTATTQVIVNTFLEIGIENMMGGAQLAFINMTRPFLLETYPMPFPKEQVVLELLESVVIDDEIIAACRRLAAAGYTIAMDDFVYNESLKPLLDIIHIIKLDVLALGMEETRRHVELLKPFKLKLLAEKIETHDIFEQCKALDFNYYQGYFLARPNLIKQQRTPTMRLTALRTLSILQNPNASIKDIEETIVQDVALSYKLLRYINSAAVAMPKKVDSIQKALVIAGTQCVRLWSTLIVLSNISEKPHELMTIALARARMCELLAEKIKLKNKDSAFTVGLFSTLDALTDQPLHEVLANLPLSDDVNDALLKYQGRSGELLRAVLAYEEGVESDEIRQLGLPFSVISDTYLEAIRWADTNIQSLTSASI